MKTAHMTLGLLAMLTAAATLAMPAQWDPFLTCSRDFVPVSRPAGPMETVVAERIVTRCVREAPPDLASITQSIDHLRPTAGNATLADLPCSKIPETLSALKEKSKEYTAAINEIDAAIAAGNEAQSVLVDAMAALNKEIPPQQSACQVAISRYDRLHQRKMNQLTALCRRMTGELRQECLESAYDDAIISPSVWPAFENMNKKCNLWNATKESLQEARSTSEKFKADLIKLRNERDKLKVLKLRTQRSIKNMERDLGSCPAP